MSVVRRFEGDGGRLGDGCDFDEGNIGEGEGGSVHVCAAKYSE